MRSRIKHSEHGDNLGIQASIRTPLEVIELVFEAENLPLVFAKKVHDTLIAALECAPGTLIANNGGKLDWAHYIRDNDGK